MATSGRLERGCVSIECKPVSLADLGVASDASVAKLKQATLNLGTSADAIKAEKEE